MVFDEHMFFLDSSAFKVVNVHVYQSVPVALQKLRPVQDFRDPAVRERRVQLLHLPLIHLGVRCH
jgi:hypothetical protein